MAIKTIYKNSLLLLLNYGFLYGGGMLFWILVSRQLSPEQVGIGTTLLSLYTLMGTISLFGLNNILLRFLHDAKNKPHFVYTLLMLAIIFSAVFSLISLIVLPYFLPFLHVLTNNGWYIGLFIIFAVGSGLDTMLEALFMAEQRVVSIIKKNAIGTAVKLITPFLIASLGGIAIFFSHTAGVLVSVITSIFIMSKSMKKVIKPMFNLKELTNTKFYALGTYSSGLVTLLPGYLLPILITHRLGTAATAFYFIPSTIANFLYLIPQVVTQNLLVLSIKDKQNEKLYFSDSWKIIMLCTAIAVTGIVVFGDLALKIFGIRYVQEGSMTLKLLAISAFPVAANYLFATRLLVQKKAKLILVVNIIQNVLLLLLSNYLINSGVVGISLAILITQCVLFVFYFMSNQNLRLRNWETT
jgi:O-antigen/teichoic acid export membrane protein